MTLSLLPVRTVAPAALLTTAEAKAHCRVDHGDDDTLIGALVQAATARVDGPHGIIGRCLVNQTWRQDFDSWGTSGDLRLPFPNVSSVVLTYFDADNAEQTVLATLYELLEDACGSFVRFLDGFTEPTVYDDRSGPVRVTMVAGYGAAAADVPQAIRTGALMLIGHWYAHRESVGEAMQEVPDSANALFAPYRRMQV